MTIMTIYCFPKLNTLSILWKLRLRPWQCAGVSFLINCRLRPATLLKKRLWYRCFLALLCKKLLHNMGHGRPKTDKCCVHIEVIENLPIKWVNFSGIILRGFSKFWYFLGKIIDAKYHKIFHSWNLMRAKYLQNSTWKIRKNLWKKTLNDKTILLLFG